jgi:2'-5' RNA ligase
MAFIGIKVPTETGRLLSGIEVPGETESTSEYHITVLCFADNWPISEVAKAMEAAYEVVSQIKPFLVKVDTVTCFPKHEDNLVPIIAKVKSDDLQDLNKKLKKAFDKVDVEYSKKFKDFKPHITLSYANKEIEQFKIDTVEFAVQEVVLWGGDYGDNRIFITFPLKGPEKRKKQSFLLQKVDAFCKMACNPPQDYLTSSYERRK